MTQRGKPLSTQVKSKFAYVTVESAAADSSSLIFCIYFCSNYKNTMSKLHILYTFRLYFVK